MYNKKEIENMRLRILIIDDDEISGSLAKHILRQSGFLCRNVLSGREGLEAAVNHPPNLILLDKRMPEMDGLETMKLLSDNPVTMDIPVVFLTAEDDHTNELTCLEAGAADFIRKPFVPEIMVQRISRIIEWNRLRRELQKMVQERTTELVRSEQHSRNLSDQIIYALAAAVDAKDEYTNGHSLRVAEYARKISARIGKSEEYQENIYYMGLLHDIGKIGIPDEIIHKTSKLTDEEYATIKEHPTIGANILDQIREMPELSIGAHYHHERYDGRGYPEGISGDDIPEQARILAVADSYDAMTSKRTYHNVKPQEFARSEIQKGRGTQFDPLMADAMLELIDEDKDFMMNDGGETEDGREQ